MNRVDETARRDWLRTASSLPFQVVEVTIQDILKKGGQSVQTARGSASNRCHQKLHVDIDVQLAEYLGLDPEQFVVELLLVGSEINRDSIRLPNGEGSDVAPARPVDDSREGMQGFEVGDELYSFTGGNAPLGKLAPDSFEVGIVLENRLPPRRCGCLVQSGCRVFCPVWSPEPGLGPPPG